MARKNRKGFTLKEKKALGKRLGINLKGKSDREIRQIVEDHDRKMPRLDRWLGKSKSAA